MSQQYPFGSYNEPNPVKFRKKLFVENGFEFIEVNGRVVEPYTPPTPKLGVQEIKIINAPSHFHQMGISSYSATLNLLFKSKQDYNDYLAFCGFTHKYYDEMGHIYVGSLESIKPVPYEGATKYLVEVNLLLIKKDGYDQKHRFAFQDIEGHWAESDIEQMADLGLIAVVSKDGIPEIYFRPADYVTRAEFIAFLNRTRRLVEKHLRE